ncbi:DUF4339 domain-containing protein [Acinetobacter schindleri]|uniref:DUF4339 domain-containing protein n=1 Tax=Acinetobacter schindleri TaxID=108981 RepID=UPI00272F8575|nr:DUF4339 domain-containing protein [Acinetobacter schindleri]MDP1445052.1 DUF4339 domain-containing protein [Acinetobacter schindleri]
MTNMQNDKWFYLDKKHKNFGAFSNQEMAELYQKKIIHKKSYVWKDGFDDWKRLEDVDLPLLQLNSKDTRSVEKNIKQNQTAKHEIGKPLIQTSEVLTKVDYAAQYKAIWLSDQHRSDVINLTERLVENLVTQKKLESFRLSPTKPDGLIIGTGEADFTKGNVPYEFEYSNKTFQLIDVPGIEGDEGKYEHLVKQATEKAHLVIYVNGTNKKPEEVTTRKIKSYINQYAKIYAICNVRGKADSYEFEEDQISLQQAHGDVDNVLNQTLTVLDQTIGTDYLEGGQCIQGLLAFSSLAFDKEKNETTISSSRKDLIKSQKSYMRDFQDLDKMKSFSQVNVLEQKIVSKFATFEQDIIESNKNKILRKIENVKEEMVNQLDQHLELQNKIKKELDVGRDSILRAITDFEYGLLNKSDNAISTSFSNISDNGCEVIENNYGDQDYIKMKMGNIVKEQREFLEESLLNIKVNLQDELMNNINEIVISIGRNIEQVQLNFNLEHSRDLEFTIGFSNTSLFDAKSMGKNLMEIGGMAALGVSIGTAFPVVGNIVGGLIGGVLGIIKTIINILSSKDSKIKKAQGVFRSNVSLAESDFKRKVRDTILQIVNVVNKDVKETLIDKIYDEYEKMEDIEKILKSQIEKLSTLNNQIKSKGYGTI